MLLYFSHLPFLPEQSCTVHIRPAVCHGPPLPPSVSLATPETKAKRKDKFRNPVKLCQNIMCCMCEYLKIKNNNKK